LIGSRSARPHGSRESGGETGGHTRLLATLGEIESACTDVYSVLWPTPQIAWPLIAQRAGCDVLVKHENHLPTGAFKVRGGLVYTAGLGEVRGLVAATRGNHGQSVAFAARRRGVSATIVVPHGNSPDKNAAMRAWGARVIEHGRDFDEALPHARDLARRDGLEFVPSLHPLLVRGVATCAFELFGAHADLDAVYVPIGLGSGILGAISAREALGLSCEIIGVVSAHADAYALSFERGAVVETPTARTLADGMAVRVPNPEAVAVIRQHAARIVRVDDDEVRRAIRHLLRDTHQLAEGAGAAALAALMQERERMRGRKVGLIMTGANIDGPVLAEILGSAG
jgi:threonine dehydratase